MLAGVDYLASDVLESRGAATVLFVCFVGPALRAHPAVGALRTAGGQAARVRRLLAGAGLRCGARGAGPLAPPAVTFAATGLVGVGYAGCQVFPMAMLPDAAAIDAARTGENRTGVYTGVWTAGETLGLALGPAVFAVVLVLGGYVSSEGGDVDPARLGGHRDHPRLLAAARGAHPAQPAWLRRYALDADAVARATTEVTDIERVRPDRRHARPAARAAGRRPAGPRRSHPGLRLRRRRRRGGPGRARGGGGVRRVQRPGPDRLPQPAADGERAGRLRLPSCSTPRTRPSGR